MRLTAGFVLAFALAGCAGLDLSPVPQAARLSQTTLTVTLSDGSLCRADWVAEGGAGRLADCGPGFDYAVAVVAKPNLLRQAWQGLTAALDAEGLVPPMAEVTITGKGRTWRFASPPPLD